MCSMFGTFIQLPYLSLFYRATAHNGVGSFNRTQSSGKQEIGEAFIHSANPPYWQNDFTGDGESLRNGQMVQQTGGPTNNTSAYSVNGLAESLVGGVSISTESYLLFGFTYLHFNGCRCWWLRAWASIVTWTLSAPLLGKCKRPWIWLKKRWILQLTKSYRRFKRVVFCDNWIPHYTEISKNITKQTLWIYFLYRLFWRPIVSNWKYLLCPSHSKV